MAANHEITVVALDPAWTSRWGAAHWRWPLQARYPNHQITRHHAACVVLGRRALGMTARRRPGVPAPTGGWKPPDPARAWLGWRVAGLAAPAFWCAQATTRPRPATAAPDPGWKTRSGNRTPGSGQAAQHRLAPPSALTDADIRGTVNPAVSGRCAEGPEGRQCQIQLELLAASRARVSVTAWTTFRSSGQPHRQPPGPCPPGRQRQRGQTTIGFRGLLPPLDAPAAHTYQPRKLATTHRSVVVTRHTTNPTLRSCRRRLRTTTHDAPPPTLGAGLEQITPATVPRTSYCCLCPIARLGWGPTAECGSWSARPTPAPRRSPGRDRADRRSEPSHLQPGEPAAYFTTVPPSDHPPEHSQR
jgi:hypothetical protein